jgi:ATP-binding cassette subfamily B protein
VTVGTIASFINYGQNLTSPLRQLANLYNSIQAALAGAERVFEILDTPSEAADSAKPDMAHPVEGRVSFKELEFAYTAGSPIIRGFSLDVQAGHTIALVGPTGAGKTTIINLLTRFYEIQNGSISIDGIDIRDMPKAELRRSLGLVLQDTFLFADSVLENTRNGRLDASDDECVDTRTEARIQTALLRLMQGRTSFVIAHRLSTIRDADLVVVIDRGQIMEQGSHDELMAMRGFYHRLYVSQFKRNVI